VQNKILNIKYQKSNIQSGFSSLFVVIVVVVVILGIVALFAVSKIKYDVNPQPEMQQVEVDEQVKTLQSLSNSDEIEAIDQDINATDLDSIDQDLGEVNSDIESL